MCIKRINPYSKSGASFFSPEQITFKRRNFAGESTIHSVENLPFLKLPFLSKCWESTCNFFVKIWASVCKCFNVSSAEEIEVQEQDNIAPDIHLPYKLKKRGPQQREAPADSLCSPRDLFDKFKTTSQYDGNPQDLLQITNEVFNKYTPLQQVEFLCILITRGLRNPAIGMYLSTEVIRNYIGRIEPNENVSAENLQQLKQDLAAEFPLHAINKTLRSILKKHNL